MELIANFAFDKRPLLLGCMAQTGGDADSTLNGVAKQYTCDRKEVSLVINGRVGCGVGRVVKPGERLGVQIKAKSARQFHIPPNFLNDPVNVTISTTQYQVLGIAH